MRLHDTYVTRATALLQRRWSAQILLRASDSPVRPSQLRREIPSASKKSLVASLQQLQREGVLLRRNFNKLVLHVEYEKLQKRKYVENLIQALSALGSTLGS
jgi:DNA-binding HxlR family transcriptional regulator